MLKDAETRYSRVEKACLSLIYVAQRLRHYSLARTIYLMTKSHPIRSLLRRPILSGRLAQWLLQLSEFEIIPIAPTAVKVQAIANLLAWFLGVEGWDVIDEVSPWRFTRGFKQLKQLELGGFLDLMGPPLLLKEELE